MQVRRPAVLAAGGLCAMFVGLGAVLPAAAAPPAGPAAPALPGPGAAGVLLVRHAGNEPVTVDTTRLKGPVLRGYWVGDGTVDAGSVQRGPAVKFFPPDTGDGAPHDWTLVIVDATRGLAPPA